MEIISYVGSASTGSTYRKKSSAKYAGTLASKLEGIKIPSFSGISLPSVRLPKIKALSVNPARVSGLAFVAVICCFVSVFVFRTCTKIQSYTGPVEMAMDYDTEANILKAAMSKFAVESNQASFDENGNVLAEDGSVLSASSLGIGKTISYTNYKVKSGDTISSIALKFGLTNISTVIAVNGIDNVRSLRAGQKLRIPNQDGIGYKVVKGDTLNSLSVKFHVSVEELVDVNDISSRNLTIGQELFIPGAKMDASSLRKAMGELFIFPISSGYRITSRFGRRADPFTGVASSHTGVDLAAPQGTAIKAAMSGKVVYVGWSNIFGNYVIINHGNGYQTLYGHMLKATCKTGTTINQGTKIGLVGSTGYSTGPHLHFTVYKNGRLVDPLTLLKK